MMGFLVIWPMITAWGGILEKKRWAYWFEPVRSVVAIILIMSLGIEHRAFLWAQVMQISSELWFTWIVVSHLRDKAIKTSYLDNR